MQILTIVHFLCISLPMIWFSKNQFKYTWLIQLFKFKTYQQHSLIQFQRKMAIVEFVQKLLNILKKQPQTVKWINNGTEFQITDIDTFTHKILPTYFRHEKFQSFIRQLNMYGFHKVNRRKNSHIFEHENFVQNREQNYRLIKRAKKVKADNRHKNYKTTQVNFDTQMLSQKAPKMAELLNKLIQFNTKNQFDHKKLKSKLELLSRQVSSKKERNLKPIIKHIRQKILVLEQIQKKVSNLNWNSLTNCCQDSPTKTNNQQSDQNLENARKIMSAPVFGLKFQEEPNKGNQGVSLNNLCSFNSISSFIAFT